MTTPTPGDEVERAKEERIANMRESVALYSAPKSEPEKAILPHLPGWYWFRDYLSWPWRIVRLETYHNGVLQDGWQPKHHRGTNPQCEWLGPLPEPLTVNGATEFPGNEWQAGELARLERELGEVKGKLADAMNKLAAVKDYTDFIGTEPANEIAEILSDRTLPITEPQHLAERPDYVDRERGFWLGDKT